MGKGRRREAVLCCAMDGSGPSTARWMTGGRDVGRYGIPPFAVGLRRMGYPGVLHGTIGDAATYYFVGASSARSAAILSRIWFQPSS
jgi:hypothetical protein